MKKTIFPSTTTPSQSSTVFLSHLGQKEYRNDLIIRNLMANGRLNPPIGLLSTNAFLYQTGQKENSKVQIIK